MAQGRKRNNFVPRTCVSPLWKDSTSSNVVTLRNMRPPQTPFTSLDTFMAAHSPRRFCQARQKYILSEYITFHSAQVFLVYFRSRENVIKIQTGISFMSEKIMACLFSIFVHAEPLTVDKRITDTGFLPVQQKTRNDSR